PFRTAAVYEPVLATHAELEGVGQQACRVLVWQLRRTRGMARRSHANAASHRASAAMFSKRAYCGRNATGTTPIGPLRCLAMMTSVRSFSSGGTSSL